MSATSIRFLVYIRLVSSDKDEYKTSSKSEAISMQGYGRPSIVQL